MPIFHVKPFFFPKLLLAVSLLFFLGACNTTRHLDYDQSFLVENKIVFQNKKKISGRRALKYDLGTTYKQKPNTNFIGIPREWFYYNHTEENDSSRWDRLVLRLFSEEPSIYKEERAESTARSMQYLLQNKGYFNAIVSYQAVTKKNKTKVTYLINPKRLYTFDSTSFESKDLKVQRILTDIGKETILKPGTAVSQENYNQEVFRITRRLQNLGFAYFDKNYIDVLEGDSTNYKVNDTLTVLLPSTSPEHQVYRVGDIFVYPNYDPKQDSIKRMVRIEGGVNFMTIDSTMDVSVQTILDVIYLKKGELYKVDNYEKTAAQLGSLDIYKIKLIKPYLDPAQPGLIHFEIKLTPKKRNVFGYDAELNNSNFISDNNKTTLIGTSLGLIFRNRNSFRGAEQFSANIQGGVDLDFLNPDTLVFAWNLSGQLDFYKPKFVDYLGLWKVMNATGILNKEFYRNLKERARSRASVGGSITSLINTYRTTSLELSLGYELQRSPQHSYLINHLGINYFSPVFEPDFEQVVFNNQFLRNSFDKQLFTGFLFRDFSYIYASRINKFGESWQFNGNVEVSGAEVLLGNQLDLSAPLRIFSGNDTINYAQFIRLEFDGRHYRIFPSKKHSIAMRLNVGIAFPFGGFSKDVPYIKQFFIGGPNSIRAFRVREPGPGGYQYVQDPNNPQPFFQTGDFKFEFSAEYRFDLFWRLKGAVFLDGGNIWTLREDEGRPNSQLLWKAKFDQETGDKIGDSFLNQIALGTGFGVRLDYYFVIRFDLGVKLKNPYLSANLNGDQSYWAVDRLSKFQLQDFNYNLAIGYPF
ncbi:MAG: BamA/TamA family outer membrane protein [Saprospiraceae bacterium]